MVSYISFNQQLVSLDSFRAYLKTVNMPKQRVFSACCAPFSLVIHKVFLRKNGAQQAKNSSLLVIFPVFR